MEESHNQKLWLERATGEYVTFVDTDDYVEPNWAEKLYIAAKKMMQI